MKIPLEISYRGVPHNQAIESLVRKKAAKLEQVCHQLNSCRVAIEKAHEHPNSGSPYRVRIDMTVPPGHELAVTKSPDAGKQYEELETVIREAFETARRRLVELNEQLHGEVQDHPEQEEIAIVTHLWPEEDYGIIKTIDETEIYFHRNSVANNQFDRLAVGTGVQVVAEDTGGDRLRASTVRIVNKPSPGPGIVDSDTPIEEILG